jgi:hypothetical protein
MAASVILLENVLARYGSETQATRTPAAHRGAERT